MKDRVDPVHLTTPYYVEWSVIAGGDDDGGIEYFSDRSEAIEFAERKDRARYAVWLAEVGVYRTDSGNLIRDYVYWWWNEKSLWGERFGGGCGYPHGAQSRPVDYIPHDLRAKSREMNE